MGRPSGTWSPEDREAMSRIVRNAFREAPAVKVEQADPEEVQAGLALAVREGRVPPRMVSEIIRLTPPSEEEQ